MLCPSERIDIWSWVEAEFELDAHILAFFIHCFLLSSLEIVFPFLNSLTALTWFDSARVDGQAAPGILSAAEHTVRDLFFFQPK